MIEAVFLDRDGVINYNRGDYVKNIKEFKIIPNVPHAIRLLNLANIKTVIVTNQSAINRGLLSVKVLNKIHSFLKDELQKYGAKVDAIYFCPHKPEDNCDCRKPKSGMILQASKDLGINCSNSLLIGDGESDMLAAKNVGMESILIQTNGDLLEIIESILHNDG